MKRRIANCPACGGPVEFQLSTALVTVCEFCHSVLARKDKRLEDHGKVADLVETGSRISCGLNGRFEKKHFEVVGRVQYQHPAGGVWDEWYLRFPGDRVKWLAEAQGKFYMLTEKTVSDQTPMPVYDSLSAGHRLELPGGKVLFVAEKGVAKAASADGDIPWDFRPNAEHRFVDLNGPDGEFATIEYTPKGLQFFLGREVTPDELGLPVDGGEQAGFASANTAALQLNCPKCAGPLTLLAPDQTQRVCCPNCRALLDCQQGKLQYLETLRAKAKDKPLIPLGAVGKLAGVKYTVIGFMERYAVYEGKKFPWTEYLLYSPAKGFRWLVCNQAHWSFVESVTLTSMPSGNSVTFNGKSYKLYDRGTAYVRYVVGEFYWRVTAGEQVDTADYIAPPEMLSFERSTAANGEELNVSRGTYLAIDDLEAAFGLKDIPRPWGVGVIQPQKPFPVDVWLIWAGLLLILFLLYAALPSGTVAAQTSGRGFHLVVALIAVTIWPAFTLIGRHTFEVSRWKDSDYSPYSQGESDS